MLPASTRAGYQHSSRPSSLFCGKGSMPSKQDVPRTRPSACGWIGRRGPAEGQCRGPRPKGQDPGSLSPTFAGCAASHRRCSSWGCPSPDSSSAETWRSDHTAPCASCSLAVLAPLPTAHCPSLGTGSLGCGWASAGLWPRHRRALTAPNRCLGQPQVRRGGR